MSQGMNERNEAIDRSIDRSERCFWIKETTAIYLNIIRQRGGATTTVTSIPALVALVIVIVWFLEMEGGEGGRERLTMSAAGTASNRRLCIPLGPPYMFHLKLG